MTLGAKIGVGAIVAGIAATAGVFLFVISPRQERAKMQHEIDAWGEDFRELQVCILGDKPMSSDATEAVTLRELTVPIGENYLKECLQKTKDLQRPEGYGSGSMAVETAWFKLKDPVGRLASRMALRTASDEWYRDPEAQRGSIAKGIDELGAAYDNLRKAAGMKPAARHGSTTARLAEPPPGTSIDLAGPVAAELQAGVIAAEGGGQMVFIRSPKQIERFPVGDGIIRAVGGAPWGAWVEGTEKKVSVRAGALDELGRPVGTGTVIREVNVVVDPDWGARTILRVHAAVGDGNLRVVPFETRTLNAEGDWVGVVSLAASPDAGKSWQVGEKLFVNGPYDTSGSSMFFSQIPPRLDFWWESGGGLNRLTFPAALAELPKLQRVEGRSPYQVCRAPKSMWWVNEQGILLESGGKLTTLPAEIGDRLSVRLLACDDTRAAHVNYTGEQAGRAARFELCSAEGCGMGTPIPAWENATVVAAFGAKHGFVAAVLADGYLVVWHAPDGGGAGLKPHPLFHMPEHELHAIAELDGQLYALISGGDGTRLVPLPAL